MKLLILPYLAICLPVAAIFADEAFQTDFHHALVGIPQPQTTFFHRPKSESRASLLYTVSEKGVLGAVNPKDGTLVWRHPLTTGQNETVAGQGKGCLRAGEGESIVVSGLGREVNAWGAFDGRLVWANKFEGEVRDLEVLELPGISEQGAKDVVVLSAEEKKGVLRRLDGNDGAVKWEHEDHGTDIPFQVSASDDGIYLITLQLSGRSGLKMKVISVDPLSGKQSGHYIIHSESDITDADDIVFVGANSASPLIAWTDKARKILKVNVIGSKHVSSLNIPNDTGEFVETVVLHAPHTVRSVPHFLVHYQTANAHWAEVYHVDIGASSVSPSHSLPKLRGQGCFSLSTEDANVFFLRTSDMENTLTSSASHGLLLRWNRTPVPPGRDVSSRSYVHAVAEVVTKAGPTYAVRAAAVTVAGTWVLNRESQTIWERWESLAGAISATWVDLKEAETLAHELEMEGHGNPLAAYVHRIRRHLKDLRYLPTWLKTLPTRVVTSFTGMDLIKDRGPFSQYDAFGFNKLIVVMTANDRLLALDTGAGGKVKWDISISTIAKSGIRSIHSKTTGSLEIVSNLGQKATLDIDSGKIENISPGASEQTGNTELLDHAIIVADGRTETIELPRTLDGIAQNLERRGSHAASPPIIITPIMGNSVKGLQLKQKSPQADVVWDFRPPRGEIIRSVSQRPPHDPVASIGKVMGDRSVMYKYLNPNLALITTVNDAKLAASFYLLDSVSGNVLYTITHEGIDTTKAIITAISQNWFVYSLFGIPVSSSPPDPTSKGYQIVVSELYESSLPNDRGPLGSTSNFSSLSPSSEPSLPYVISQSFVIPEAISSMSVTQTRQGISTRSLLCYLPLSNSLIAIPKGALDPRRPVGRDPTPAEQEEGLSKYTPVLELSPKWVLSHKLELLGIKKIITSPALLESTALVFAYGLDVFGTRVTPSQAFDILGKGFNKIQLVLTVFALTCGVIFVAPMVRKKQINSRWQIT